MRIKILRLLLAAACCIAGPALHAATPLACDPDAGLTLPDGFCALVAADGLGTARTLWRRPTATCMLRCKAARVGPGHGRPAR